MGTLHFPPPFAHLLHRSVPTSNAKFSSGAFFCWRIQGSGSFLASKGKARYILHPAFASSHPYLPTRTLLPCNAAGQNFHFCFLFNQILKLADSKVRAVKARAIFIGPFSTTASPEKFVSLRAFHMMCVWVWFVNSEVHRRGSSKAVLRGKSTVWRTVHLAPKDDLLWQEFSSSCQILHDEKHNYASQNHSPNHEVFILKGSLLNQPHYCIG